MDKEIQCECGKLFLFTDRDQAFFAEKGFQPPKRCRDCRLAKKENKNSQPQLSHHDDSIGNQRYDSPKPRKRY